MDNRSQQGKWWWSSNCLDKGTLTDTEWEMHWRLRWRWHWVGNNMWLDKKSSQDNPFPKDTGLQWKHQWDKNNQEGKVWPRLN
jgi:hypothetical protein